MTPTPPSRERIDRFLAESMGRTEVPFSSWDGDLTPKGLHPGQFTVDEDGDVWIREAGKVARVFSPTTNGDDLLEVRAHHRAQLDIIPGSAGVLVAKPEVRKWREPHDDTKAGSILAAATALYRALGGSDADA